MGKSVDKQSTPSLNVISSLNIISEEDSTAVEEEEPSKDSASEESIKSRPKRKISEQMIPEAPPKRRSRRVTITTLGTDVDLFTPVKTSASTSGIKRESTGSVGTKKRYIPVKK